MTGSYDALILCSLARDGDERNQQDGGGEFPNGRQRIRAGAGGEL
jgi:hypothetical protein